MHSTIIGTGRYLPFEPVYNDLLPSDLGTNDEWIRSRTGIRARHFARELVTADLAEGAARASLAMAGVRADQVDAIVVATITSEMLFPSLAAQLQHRLGMRSVGAFDLAAACSGFVYGLAVVDAMVRSGTASTVLLVCAEKMSRLLSPTDRSTAVLFGDGAGAVVLGRSQRPGVVAVDLYSDGSVTKSLNCAPGLNSRFIHMDGPVVFRLAVRAMSQAVNTILAKKGMLPADVDWFVPHQANQRIVEAVAANVGVPMDRVVLTVGDHANVSAASIPMALDLAVRDGRIRAGDKVLLAAAGGGLTWAGALIEWGS